MTGRDGDLPSDEDLRWLAEHDPVRFAEMECLLHVELDTLRPAPGALRLPPLGPAADIVQDTLLIRAQRAVPPPLPPAVIVERVAMAERHLPGRRIAWQWRLFGFAGRWLILTPARRRHLEAERRGRQEPRLGRW